MIISRDDVYSDEYQYFENSFLKLDATKYAALLGVTLAPPQIAFLNALNNPHYRYITAVYSRRLGKTYVANLAAQLVSLVPGCKVLIISPDYTLSNISWNLQLEFLKKFDIELTKRNQKDKELVLSNGSTVYVGSINKVDSRVGQSYDYILFDEAALSEADDAFSIQLQPCLDKPNSKAVFISTFRGTNYFYEYYLRGFSREYPQWCSLKATMEDDIRTPSEVFESSRRNMTAAQFAQEYMCEVSSIEGQVWGLPEAQILDELPEDFKIYDRISGMDVGFRDPTALCVAYSDGKKVIIVDEYLENKLNTAEYAADIRPILETHGVDYTYIDSAAAQTKHDLATLYDIQCINANKNVLPGVAFVKMLIETERLFILRKCTECISSLNHATWDDRSTTREKIKHNSYVHMADAIRYMLYSHAANLEIDDEL